MKIFFLILVTLSCTHHSPLRGPSSVSETTLLRDVWPLEHEGCQNRKDDYLSRTSSVRVTWAKVLKKECNVQTGKWKDFFTGEEITRADDAVVTVVTPLSHLRQKGLKDMPAIRVTAIVRDEEFFIILKKSGEGFRRFRQNTQTPGTPPTLPAHACTYVGMWKDFKDKWGIDVSAGEKNFLSQQESRCGAADAYEREYFKHWSIVPGKGCHARTEALKRDSITALTNTTPGNCTDFSGASWLDIYSNERFTDHRAIDVDHFVPLMNAFVSGAWKWPAWKKELYANFMKDPFHLVSVSARENRSKGAKHPGLYVPPFEESLCDYVRQWTALKLRWNLTFTVEESEAIKGHAQRCTAFQRGALEETVEFLKSNRRTVELIEPELPF